MPRPRVSTSALAASAAAIAAAVSLAACGGGGAHARTTAAAKAPPQPRHVTVTVSSRAAGHSLPANFIGLAMENWTLTKHQFAHTNLRRYLLALGPDRLLRIAGNSVDRSFWTSRHERRPGWARRGTATPESLRQLAAVLRGTGWRVLLGVNLLHYDVARAVDEARYATRILGPNLGAIEIGNEPDRYGISEARYLREFRRYVGALRRAVPGIEIAGPDMSSSGHAWVSWFAREQAPAPQIALFTAHNYPLSACNGKRPTIADLLSVAVQRSARVAADRAAAAGRLDHVPAAIDEANSAVCWGEPGTSDVFASALWSLDYTLQSAQAGLSGVDYQGRIGTCAAYSPVCTGGHGATLHARPEFYGLLAAQQVRPGAFLALTNPDAANLRAYAVKAPGGGLSVVLDNLSSSTKVRLRLPGRGYRSAQQTVLRTSSSRGLSATGQITLGGRAMGANAAMAAPRYRPLRLRGRTVTIPVAAHTAAILHIR